MTQTSRVNLFASYCIHPSDTCPRKICILLSWLVSLLHRVVIRPCVSIWLLLKQMCGSQTAEWDSLQVYQYF